MRTKKGDGRRDLEKAFITARRKASTLILRITRNQETLDDILQNTYEKAWKGYNNFKGGSTLDTWICAIARNEALIFLKKGRRYNILIDTETVKAKQKEAFTDDPYYSLQASNIERAVEAMPSPILKAVLKRRMLGESEREIAADLGVPEGTIKSRYRRAKEYLIKHSEEI